MKQKIHKIGKFVIWFWIVTACIFTGFFLVYVLRAEFPEYSLFEKWFVLWFGVPMVLALFALSVIVTLEMWWSDKSVRR